MPIFTKNLIKNILKTKANQISKKSGKIKILLTLFLSFLIFSPYLFEPATSEELFNTRDLCASENGVWREFGNDCADNCYLDRGHNLSCASKITFGCDCLENKCWDYYRCIDEEQYQVEAESEEEARKTKMKEENPELFLSKKELHKLLVKRLQKLNPDNVPVDETDDSGIQTGEGAILDEANPEGSAEEVEVTGKQLSETEQIEACAVENGTWKKFPNGCVDSCSSKSGPAICASVITESCDCGEEKCWNGSACVLISDL